VNFFDLSVQHHRLKEELLEAMRATLDSGRFALGPMVERFETEFARFCGAEFAVAVNSGTSALHLALLGLGVGEGDEVITAPNTFIATTEAISMCGAKPVFADIDPETRTLDPSAVEKALTENTAAIVPVHLYGTPAPMEELMAVAGAKGISVVEDACQAHGAECFTRWKGGTKGEHPSWKKVGTVGHAGCFSFYPAKNLGALGEGGILVTDDGDLARRARALREHGQEEKYIHVREGFNYRMDAIQGAVLSIKLRHLDEWNAARRELAARYDEGLKGLDISLPVEPGYARSVYHLYVIESENREKLRTHLAGKGVATGLHYPVALHLQRAYECLGYAEGSFPAAERSCAQVLSLPIYPELEASGQELVIEAVRGFCESAVEESGAR